MRNLQLHCYEKRPIPNLKLATHFVQNSDDLNEIFVCDGLCIIKIGLEATTVDVLCNLDDEVPNVAKEDIVDVYFLSIERTLGVALKSGQVLLVNVDDSSVNLHSVGEFLDTGIEALGLSPDQELLAIVTRTDVYLVNSLLEIIVKEALSNERFGEREFITVGWGKKETQFHGSEGKEAAKQKPPSTTDFPIKTSESHTITWRGDGSLFAVGHIEDSQTTFKVYNREGALQYTSEKQPGIECNFAWRPSGNLIATTQQFPNKYVIAFFEKNGLKHGDFILNIKSDQVNIKNLSWSGDSEVLCLWYEEIATKVGHILLYTSGNYHWYLKQSYTFPAPSQITSIRWQDTSSSYSNKCLYAFLNDGNFIKFEWVWATHHSNGKTLQDDATVGVIDGNKLLLTSFRHSVIPPPLASNTFEFPNNINHIVFGPKDPYGNINSNSFGIILDDGVFEVFTKETKNKYVKVGSCHLDVDDKEIIKSTLWMSDKLVLAACGHANTVNIYIFDIMCDSNIHVSKIKKTALEEDIVGFKYFSPHEIMLQSKQGKLSLFSFENGASAYNQSFPECCHEFDVVNINGDIVLFGLTMRNRFYIDDCKIANNINSYFIHSHFLMMTTLQHQLLSCPLIKSEINGLQNAGQNEKQELFLSNRRIERGSRLVTVVPFDNRTILQMPRGNIEVIQPRALSLKIIGNYLDHQNYNAAFDLMRKQRINLNLIYDHDPNAFLNHLNVFISQISNTSWLSLFITELEDQDVTKSIYKTAYKNNLTTVENKNKVQQVCELMRQHLRTNNERNKNLLPILTTYVKNHDVNDLENALLEIKKVREDEKTHENMVSSNEALKYLLYMVNVDELYNIALGLNDFDLVMFVANKSQKDPKEYIPYLNNLMNMEENYRRYNIDKDLKRFESALKHLIGCVDRDEELIIFIKQHTLYTNALSQINSNELRYQKIAEEFARYLEMRNHYSEAGFMYRRSLNYKNALECFIQALEWQSAMFMAYELKLSKEEILLIQSKLLEKLKESGAFEDALLLLENSSNFDEKISCALEGKLYKRALNICLNNNQRETIENIVKPAVMEQSVFLLELIRKNEQLFISHKCRLLIVKQINLEKSKMEKEEENLAVDCDLYSDTSSIMGSTSSKSSGRSYRSSKNRRKHERKMVSLKEGSKYEDIALTRALHTLIIGTFSLRKDVSQLNYTLQWLGCDEIVSELQRTLENILNIMSKSFDEIWAPFSQGELTLQRCPQNNLEVPTLEPHLRIPPVIQEFKWKLQTN